MKNSILKTDFKIIKCVVVALVLTVFIGNFYRLVLIDGSSMEPTLNDGQIVAVKLRQEPQRGDIIVINSTALGRRIVKRVIVVEGDGVMVSDKWICVNGVNVEDGYVDGAYEAEEEVLTIPPHGFYVLGDNRNHSDDSRRFGIIYREEIMGVVTTLEDIK